MDALTISLISLRGVALALEHLGQARVADSIYGVADLAEAGHDVDAHMAQVAAKLKDRNANDADWGDVVARIEADSARLQAVGKND